MQQNILVVFAGAMFLVLSGCQTQRPNAAVGGLLGGTTGGMVGAAIGSREGNSGEGALIGAVAGGLTGAAIGNQADQEQMRYQQSQTQNAIAAQRAAVTSDQIVQMTQSGLSEDLIVNQIKANGLAQRVSTNDIIQLKSQGVSDTIIRQMQTNGTQSITSNPMPQIYAPVPVTNVSPFVSPVYRAGPIFRPAPMIRPVPVHHHRRPRAGFSMHF